MELVLVIDTTGSMKELLETCKAQARKILLVAERQNSSFKVGVVAFRTMADPEYTTMFLDLTADLDKVNRFVSKLQPRGGGAETVDIGLARAVNEMSWTRGARKVILLIGDEEPRPARRAGVMEAARLAKERGIIIHTLTASKSAWMYWSGLHPDAAADYLEEHGRSARDNFVMPDYAEVSQIAGGLSKGSMNAGGLIRWMLAVATAREKNADEIDIEAFRKWRPPEKKSGTPKVQAERGKNPPAASTLLAELRDDSGSWNARHAYGTLFASLTSEMQFEPPRKVPVLLPADLKNFRPAIAYLSYNRRPEFSYDEIAALKDYVAGGGILWVDCCCCSPAFTRFALSLAADLTGSTPRPLPPSHPVFLCAYDLSDAAAKFGSGPGALVRVSRPETGGDGITGAVLVTAWDLGAAWNPSNPFFSPPLNRELSLRLGANILVWSLMKKSD